MIGADWHKQLEANQSFHLRHQIFHLRQNLVLELRIVADPGIQRADAAHRRVQTLEQLIRDASRDFRAVAPRQAVLVRDHHAAGFLDRRLESPPNRRAKAIAQIDHLDRACPDCAAPPAAPPAAISAPARRR